MFWPAGKALQAQGSIIALIKAQQELKTTFKETSQLPG